MFVRSLLWQTIIASSLLLFHLSSTLAKDVHLEDPNLFHFVTVGQSSSLASGCYADRLQRPDLQAPKWNITIFNETRMSPGSWFIAPKQAERRHIGTGAAWVGPTIYDGSGELVWSGTAQLDSPNCMDFRISEIDGEPLLAMLDRDRRSGVFLDSSFRVRHVLDALGDGDSINGHELKVVDDGRSVLVIRNYRMEATEREKAAVGFEGDVCWARYNNFVELDVETGEVVFEFHARGQIGIDESTHQDLKRPLATQCNITWDFM